MNYDQLLFSELRLIAVTENTAPLTEENLVKAMTVNAELRALGYTLPAGEIIRLAKSADADTLADRVRSYIGDVKAKPMYPNFPSQVMELDEAVFRFHQLLHYLSTYGIEELTGAPVKACDLRAGAALMIAGLAAQGVTTIEDIYHIERGYADMEGKLRALGANIEKKAITQNETVTQPDQDAV